MIRLVEWYDDWEMSYEYSLYVDDEYIIGDYKKDRLVKLLEATKAEYVYEPCIEVICKDCGQFEDRCYCKGDEE